MRRRTLLTGLGVGIAATSGCVSTIAKFDSETTESLGSCDTVTPTATTVPSAENLAIIYQVFGGDAIQYESFSLVNTGDSRVDLSGYRVAFGTRGTDEIQHVVLVPTAELRIVTVGSPLNAPAAESCPNQTHVVEHHLKRPLFADGRARISVVAPDGSQVIAKTFELS